MPIGSWGPESAAREPQYPLSTLVGWLSRPHKRRRAADQDPFLGLVLPRLADGRVWAIRLAQVSPKALARASYMTLTGALRPARSLKPIAPWQTSTPRPSR